MPLVGDNLRIYFFRVYDLYHIGLPHIVQCFALAEMLLLYGFQVFCCQCHTLCDPSPCGECSSIDFVVYLPFAFCT